MALITPPAWFFLFSCLETREKLGQYAQVFLQPSCRHSNTLYFCIAEGMNLYMYIFGVMKSFSVYRFGVLRFILCICGTLLIIPFTLIIENIAVIWGVIGRKHKFYIVSKEFRQSPVIIA